MEWYKGMVYKAPYPFWERMIELQSQTDKRSEDFYGGTDPDPPRDNYSWVMRDAAIIKLLDNYSTQFPAGTPHSKLCWMRSMGFKFSMF